MISAYNGSEPYIFVSYAHKDSKDVFSTIEQLTSLGYRIWYDEGIRPGVEWPEYIANHLDRCSLFMMFISKNSVESANCRREINFALSRSKPFLCIVLEDTEIPLGMELQLASQQSIFKYHYASEKEYIIKVCSAAGMAACKDTHFFAESRPELARMDTQPAKTSGRAGSTGASPGGYAAGKPQGGGSAGAPSGSAGARSGGRSGGTGAKKTGYSGSGGSFDAAPTGGRKAGSGRSDGKNARNGGSDRAKKEGGFPIMLIGFAAVFAIVMYLLMRSVLGGGGAATLTPTPTPTVTPTVTPMVTPQASGDGTTEPSQATDDGTANGNGTYDGNDGTANQDEPETYDNDETPYYLDENYTMGDNDLVGQGEADSAE